MKRCVLQKEMYQVKQSQTTQPNKEMDKVFQALEEQHPTIIFSGIREEEAAETPPSAALTKEGTEFVFSARESDTLQEIPRYISAKRSPSTVASRTVGGEGADSHSIPERIIGKCPVAVVNIGGVSVSCLLDSGSEVSTITVELFNTHFKPKGQELLSTSGWLKLIAANGLEIPYLGYFELDIEAFGLSVPRRGILVIKDSANDAIRARKRDVPGLLGMNVPCEMGQVLAKFEGTEFLSKVDPVWSQPMQAAKRRANTSVRGIVRVAGKRAVRVPASSVTTIPATGWGGQVKCEMAMVEPVVGQHLSHLVVPNTLVRPSSPFCVRVANLTNDDLWIQPRTRIGVLHAVSNIESDVVENTECPCNGLSPEQQEKLDALLNKHASVFSKSDDDIGYTETVKHKIRTEDDIPITQPCRRIPPNQYQEVKEHIQKLLDSSVIRESHSPYASPIVLVRKKNGSLRLCVDYRKLNLRTQKDSFPLPRIDESLDALNGAQWFTTLDLASGFNQVAVEEEDRRPHSLLR
ncbi:Retrovirus-related Pol poly from transposon [Paramuricea clavata]|uniref:Retrovirus-related Pol poly from transposon, partial n=1 Tax=Paramuricea clavata TaxID=317549 RepID=A0A6S7FXP6_PARCT|nr:Retrovirus-related Pol poly from transposon [Paramuricea clavata]